MSKDVPEYDSGPAEIPYRLPWRSSDVRIGAHRSKLEGSGGYFRDFVPLLRSPDPRRIDLRVSARDPFEGLHVRRFEQKASVSVYALVDVSASMGFRGDADKMRLAADLCTALAASVRRAGDAFGMIGCDAIVQPDLMFLATRARGSEIEMLRRLRTFRADRTRQQRPRRRRRLDRRAPQARVRHLRFLHAARRHRSDVRRAIAPRRHSHHPLGQPRDGEATSVGDSLSHRFRGRPAAPRRHAPASAGGMAKEERAPSRRAKFDRGALRTPAIRNPRPHRLGPAGSVPRRRPRMMRMLMALVAVGLTAATGALARAPVLSVSDTRPFGYFIGDAIHREVVLRLEPGDALDTASLPRPGPLNYWLELSTADLEHRAARATTRSIACRSPTRRSTPRSIRGALVIPAFKLKVTGAQDSEVNVPAFSFLMSPIRQLFTDKGQSSDTVTKLRPDRPAPREPHRARAHADARLRPRSPSPRSPGWPGTMRGGRSIAARRVHSPRRRASSRPTARRPARRGRLPRRAAEVASRLRPRRRAARARRRRCRIPAPASRVRALRRPRSSGCSLPRARRSSPTTSTKRAPRCRCRRLAELSTRLGAAERRAA